MVCLPRLDLAYRKDTPDLPLRLSREAFYRKNVTLFADSTLKRFDLQTARSFVASLQAKESRYENHPVSPEKKGKLSAYTIHGYVRTLKVFSAWLYEEGFTTTDVLTKLKRPKLPQTMIEVLTDEEIGRIMDSINPNTYLGARLYTIVLLLLDTGIRADELLGLTVENTDVEGGRLKVRGYNGWRKLDTKTA